MPPQPETSADSHESKLDWASGLALTDVTAQEIFGLLHGHGKILKATLHPVFSNNLQLVSMLVVDLCPRPMRGVMRAY